MIKIPVKAEGVDDVKAALRSIRDAHAELEHAAIASSSKIAAAQLHDIERVAAARKKAHADFDGGIGRGGGGGAGGGPRGGSGGGTTGGDLLGMGHLDASINSAVSSITKLGAIGIGLSALKSGLDMATEALKTFGGFVINEVMAPAMRLDTKAQQVANNSGGKLTGEFVTERSRMYGRANNIDPEKLMNAAGTFQNATGESKMGFDLLNVIGTLSKSRGFDPNELAGMAGAVYEKGMSVSDVEKILLMQLGQGDTGSITLGEMSRLSGAAVAPSDQFAGNRESRIGMAGALLMGSRHGFKSADEAATGLASFTSDAQKVGRLISPTSIIKGVDGVEKIADPARLIGDIFRKNSGNATALHSLGFSDPSTKLIQSYGSTYSKAFAEAKGGGSTDKDAREKAATAVEEFIKTFVAANVTLESESSSRDKVMATAAEQWDTAIAQMKDEVLKAKPALEALVKHLVEHAPDIGKAALTITEALISVADWVEENFGGGSGHKSKRRREDFERGQAALDRDIATTKAEGGDTTALEKEKATKAAAQQRTEDTLSALTGTKLEEELDIGRGRKTRSEVAPEKAALAYENILADIRKDPTRDVATYNQGVLSDEQKQILQRYQSAAAGDMKANIEGGAKSGIDETSLAASIAKATAEFEKMAGAAQALNRSQAFTGKQ